MRLGACLLPFIWAATQLIPSRSLASTSRSRISSPSDRRWPNGPLSYISLFDEVESQPTAADAAAHRNHHISVSVNEGNVVVNLLSQLTAADFHSPVETPLSSSELQTLSDAFRRSSPVDPLCCMLEPRRPLFGCGTPSCSYSRTCFCYSPCERPPGGPSTHNLLTRRQIAAWSWRIAMRRHLRWRLQTVELYC